MHYAHRMKNWHLTNGCRSFFPSDECWNGLSCSCSNAKNVQKNEKEKKTFISVNSKLISLSTFFFFFWFRSEFYWLVRMMMGLCFKTSAIEHRASRRKKNERSNASKVVILCSRSFLLDFMISEFILFPSLHRQESDILSCLVNGIYSIPEI